MRRQGDCRTGAAGWTTTRAVLNHVLSMVATQPAKRNIQELAARIWETADELRANSHLKAAEYSIPVLGLIFLKFADSRFTALEAELKGKATGRRAIGKTDYQARGVLYLPEQARFRLLLLLKESENIGKAINDAMAAIEEENSQLGGVLPRTYQEFSNSTLVSLLRSVNAILGNMKGTPSARCTSTSSASSPSPRAPREASTSRRPQSCD